MGKKNKTINTAMWAIQNPGKTKEMEERFGVNVRRYPGRKGDSYESPEEYRESSNWHNDMTDAARNDYDLRDTLQAAAMSGKGKAQKILDRGFNNLGDVANAMNFSEKAAKRHGQGGDFSSNSDFMGLTDSMNKRDRRKFTELLDKKYSSKDNDGNDADEAVDRSSPSLGEALAGGYVSKAILDADARVNQFAKYQTSGEESANQYTDETNEGVRDDEYTHDRAFSWLADYKLDLAKRYSA